MSLYNLFFGMNQWTPIIVGFLGIKVDDIERFRDASFDIDANEISILTRTGGNNAEEWPNEKLTSHPWFDCHEDDDFDCTYAHFFFRVPPVVSELMAALNAEGAPLIADTTEDHEIFAPFRERLEASGCAHVPKVLADYAAEQRRKRDGDSVPA